ADVAQVVDALLGERGEDEPVAGGGLQADGELDAGAVEIAGGEEPLHGRRLVVLLAAELGLDRRGDVDAGGGGDGDDAQAGALDLQVGRGDVLRADLSSQGEEERGQNEGDLRDSHFRGSAARPALSSSSMA